MFHMQSGMIGMHYAKIFSLNCDAGYIKTGAVCDIRWEPLLLVLPYF